MALKANFEELQSYKLIGVTVTDRELGHGSYATVLQLDYMGLKCAGKKIHELLVRQGDTSYTVRRFEEECRLLSQVRHPNIVQFLGVHFQEGVTAPILVMEFLPTNLTSCIEQYGILPKEISYSILHDVALGLCYLHSQTPPIIHRDLSSNNVLLTANMTAKISDLGVARILNLTPLQVSRMTQTPGTPAYMPPEVMIANPKYDASVDQFSYGIMMIHMFSGRWPEPQVGPIRTETGKMIPVSEAERREVFLQSIGNDHPLIELMYTCINNDPNIRPVASDIVKLLAEMTEHFPTSFGNQKEILNCKENDLTQEESAQVVQVGACKSVMKKQSSKSEKQEIAPHLRSSQEMDLETKHLLLILKNATEQIEILESERRAQEMEKRSIQVELAALKQRIEKEESLQKNALEIFEQKITHERRNVEESMKEEHKRLIEDERRAHRRILEKERQKCQDTIEELEAECQRRDKLLGESKRACDELRSKSSALRVESLTSANKIESLQSSVSSLEEILEAKEAVISGKESELKVKTRVLKEKEATIARMSEQLTKATEHLSTKQQSIQADIRWKQCSDLPVTMCNGRTVVIDNNVYFRGMCPQEADDDNILLCYDHKRDWWSALPPLPVKWFGLGKVHGRLVAVGGLKKDEEATNNVYTLNFVQKWKTTLPPMPTARSLPGVLSLQEMLIVAGGYSSDGDHSTVEIFNYNSLQWYTTNPMPVASREVSLVAIDDVCYAVGGYKFPFRLNQALSTSVDDLLHNAVPANQTTHSGRSADAQSAWKTLPNTPTYRPAAIALAGSLVVVGGGESSIAEGDKKEVYMYSPSTASWVYISDLPKPRSRTTAIELSSTEILVIGGVQDGKQFNDVYKGTLQIKN